MNRTFQPILLATGNPKKIREIRAILEPIGIDIQSLDELGTHLVEPEETGDTFEANARLKAVGYAEQTGRVCLADDSGLEVDALQGRPGIMSARYSQSNFETDTLDRSERDARNNAKLMRELETVPMHQRSARFVCAMCLVAANSDAARDAGLGIMKPSQDPIMLATSRGTFEGAIGLPGDVPRGNFGFGYDPLFLVGPQFTQTSAELAPEVKNSLSHRGLAAREIAKKLRVLRSLR
ncbi:MAG TPA: non-canonical purine NTP pyrophosphatase [Phycisphaerales bacterium]|nr:non-canonical purine NTP pyrophosphatase [Phycisphaerales bacterium]